jgi:ribokinase
MAATDAERAAGAGRVVVFGTLNVDLVWQVAALPRPGETVVARATERQFGGKGANQAVAAARQGAAVTLVGAVGDDAAGRDYRALLAREGIAADSVATVPGVATGTAHVYVDARGENLIVVDPGANARIAPAALRAVLPGAAVLLVQLEAGAAAGAEALRIAAACGVPALLNASPVPADFPWGDFPVEAAIVNEPECRAIFGQTPEELAALAAPERRARLRAKRVAHLVATQGAAPTLHFSADAGGGDGPAEVGRVPTLAVVPRDTVGAGDTFAGTLAARRAAGWAWPEALRHANAAAALATLALGAQAAMPTRAAVDAALSATGPNGPGTGGGGTSGPAG